MILIIKIGVLCALFSVIIIISTRKNPLGGLHNLPKAIQERAASLPEYRDRKIQAVSAKRRILKKFPALVLLAYMGAVCGFLTHFCACIKPLIYKAVDLDTGVTERIIQRMRKAAAIPFYIPFVVFCFAVPIILIVAMANGFLTVSPLWLLITPLPVQIFVTVLKKLNNRIFFDFPYCCGIALGMSGYAVIALLNLM